MNVAGGAAPGVTQLEGQTVAVIGGSAGIGLATAKRARALPALAANLALEVAPLRMANTALAGATYDIDGGRQFAPAR
jgi:NAD(P)-dependent dehydrogenase (short-subunit alcohol dehydrogenase family)